MRRFELPNAGPIDSMPKPLILAPSIPIHFRCARFFAQPISAYFRDSENCRVPFLAFFKGAVAVIHLFLPQ